MKIAVRVSKTGSIGLLPQDGYNEQLMLDNLKRGDCYLISPKKQRQPKFHRFYFKGLSIFIKNLPESFQKKTGLTGQLTEAQIQKLYTILKIATGYVDYVTALDGSTHMIPRSISFDKMDEVEFREFVSDCERIFEIEAGWSPFDAVGQL